MQRTALILIALLFTVGASFSQPLANSDSSSLIAKDNKRTKSHPPNRAMLFSVILPGAGQVYNRKYWKVPIIYAAMGTTIYFAGVNNKYYKEYHQGYINKTDGKDSTIDLYPDYSETQLYELENYHRKYRDLNIILTGLFYTLNIVDAYVDAHLMHFDVSDDLSLHILPAMNFSAINRKPRAGLTLALTF